MHENAGYTAVWIPLKAGPPRLTPSTKNSSEPRRESKRTCTRDPLLTGSVNSVLFESWRMFPVPHTSPQPLTDRQPTGWLTEGFGLKAEETAPTTTANVFLAVLISRIITSHSNTPWFQPAPPIAAAPIVVRQAWPDDRTRTETFGFGFGFGFAFGFAFGAASPRSSAPKAAAALLFSDSTSMMPTLALLLFSPLASSSSSASTSPPSLLLPSPCKSESSSCSGSPPEPEGSPQAIGGATAAAAPAPPLAPPLAPRLLSSVRIFFESLRRLWLWLWLWRSSDASPPLSAEGSGRGCEFEAEAEAALGWRRRVV
mmetsp:Transcript_7658/g.14252  ORF Transcript_7658/g.14252 Transcript_7658/m.14252 type:complete len:313 (-) Transcript_7658:2243-3181(-)